MSHRSVFVGNLPYDANEETLTDVFRQVGPVVNFRLVYDKGTGESKGFGFCEYTDAALVFSAIRNLNGREYNGRTLRVDFADERDREALMKQLREEEATSEPPAKKRRRDEVQGDLETMPLQELLKIAFTPMQELAIRRLIAEPAPMPIPQPTFTMANVARNVTTSERLHPPGMR